MSSVAVHLIFWLPSGYHYDPGNATAAGDDAYESGFEQFFRDLSGSEYANVVAQYYGNPSSSSPSASIDGADPSYYASTISVDAITDTTQLPGAGGVTSSCTAAETLLGYSFLCDSEVQNEIASDINASTNGWSLHNPADPSAYHDIWMVILPAGIEAGTDGTVATTDFGGYHGNLCTLNGAVHDQDCFAPGAQFGVFSVSTDGNINDQTPLPATSTANGDGWLDWTLADASHELFESITDPSFGLGWITTNVSQNNEIADSCEQYGNWPGEAGGYDVLLNGHKYLVNPLLSNAQDALVSNPPVACSLGFDGQYIDFGLELGNGSVQNGGSVQYGIAPFTVAASATSGLPVTFIAGGACSVGDVQPATAQTTAQGTNIAGTSAQVTLTGTGTCTITASQPGNQGGGGFYEAATPVTQSFMVTPGTACSQGSYSTTGDTPCTAADAGSFVSGTGATAESPCLAGTYQPQTGQSSCLSADAGSFVANAGSASESQCLAGTYQPQAGQSSCLSADAGSFVASAGSASESQCLAGSYQPQAGQSSCVPAANGYYVSSAGQASETACPVGTSNVGTGNTSCTASTSLSYTGPGQSAISSSFTPAATLSSPVSACESSQPVNFSVSPDPLTPSVSSSSLSLGTPSTNAAGMVSVGGVSTSGWASGVYTITVTYAGTTVCAGSTNTAPLAVTAPGRFALGYGSYTPAVSLGSTSFGFFVSHIKASTTYTGHLGVLTPREWRFRANVTSFGLTGSSQGLLGGTGSLYWWNSSLNKGRGGWQLAASGVAYKATANAATKTTPASFGITITYTPVSPQPSSLPNSSPVTLAKGTIKIT